RDERSFSAGRRVMKAAGEDLFADAALAFDQHGDGRVLRPLEDAEDVSHRGRRAERAAEAIVRGEDDVAEAGVERDRDRRRADREQRVAGQDDLANADDAAELRAVAALVANEKPVGAERERQVLARDGAVANT